MNKKFSAALAIATVASMGAVFAANPFSDVTPNDWAYQAVSQLASAGVINGYPDGTFKGQNNITRYEMAQMVAKAMANQARVDAEQQAMINRLADEFSDELNTLGVRVGKLEKQVGNLTYTGDARIRFMNGAGNGNKWEYRARLQFENKVNENTSVVARFKIENQFGQASSDSNHAYIDLAYAKHNFGEHVSVEAGRTELFVGQGLLYDDTFDGAKATINIQDKVTFTGAYGYPIVGENEAKYSFEDNRADKPVTLAQIDAMLGNHVAATAFYLKGTKEADNVKVYGFGLTADYKKVQLYGEWAKDDNLNNSKAWVAGIGYGDYDLGAKGTWDIGVRYFNEGVNAPIFSSTYDQPKNSNYKTWSAVANYALLDNVGLGFQYYFDSKTQDGTKVDDFLYASLEYQF